MKREHAGMVVAEAIITGRVPIYCRINDRIIGNHSFFVRRVIRSLIR